MHLNGCLFAYWIHLPILPGHMYQIHLWPVQNNKDQCNVLHFQLLKKMRKKLRKVGKSLTHQEISFMLVVKVYLGLASSFLFCLPRSKPVCSIKTQNFRCPQWTRKHYYLLRDYYRTATAKKIGILLRGPKINVTRCIKCILSLKINLQTYLTMFALVLDWHDLNLQWVKRM